MRCESALIRLDELRTGELDSREVDAVREHLEHCEYCEGVYRRISGIASSARSLLGECPTSCADSLERKLFDRVAHGQRGRPRSLGRVLGAGSQRLGARRG